VNQALESGEILALISAKIQRTPCFLLAALTLFSKEFLTESRHGKNSLCRNRYFSLDKTPVQANNTHPTCAFKIAEKHQKQN